MKFELILLESNAESVIHITCGDHSIPSFIICDILTVLSL